MWQSLESVSSSLRPKIHTAKFEEKNYNDQKKKISCDFVKSLVCITFDISLESLNAKTRQGARTALARQIAMYLVHVRFGINLAEIGQIFNRDRTTVSHACRLVEDMRDRVEIDFLIECLERSVSEWQKLCHSEEISL